MLECVVNVSEGRDPEVVAAIAAAAGPDLLDVHTCADHNRSVLTLVGDVPPDELMLVANSVPVHRTTSIGHRLRQACRALVQTFTGGR